jgi:hypothetical protein
MIRIFGGRPSHAPNRMLYSMGFEGMFVAAPDQMQGPAMRRPRSAEARGGASASLSARR